MAMWPRSTPPEAPAVGYADSLGPAILPDNHVALFPCSQMFTLYYFLGIFPFLISNRMYRSLGLVNNKINRNHIK